MSFSMHFRWFIIGLVAFGYSACGDDASAPPTDTEAIDTPTSVHPDINCANACKRQPLCTPDLVTEQDCLAVCNGQEDPHLYACCIQSVATCAGVEQCTSKTKVVCDETAELWIPIAILEECVCGDGQSIDANKECKSTGPDHRCETGVCLKPVNDPGAPFCTVDCTNAPDKCPDSMKCQHTPKTWYCSY